MTSIAVYSIRIPLLLLTTLVVILSTACAVEMLPADSTSSSPGSLETVDTSAAEQEGTDQERTDQEGTDQEGTDQEGTDQETEGDAPAQPAASARGGVAAPTAADLARNSWTLHAYGATAALKGMVDDSEVTAEFTEDGNLTGNASCNRYFTTFQVENGLISIGPVGTTRMFCNTDALQEQETQFVAALELMSEPRPFRLISEQLEIDLGDGNALIFSTR